MTAAAHIAKILHPLVDPRYFARHNKHKRTFAELYEDDRPSTQCVEYLRGNKRVNTHALDWASDKLIIASKDKWLRLYDVTRGSVEREWAGEYMSMQVDPNSPHIVAAISWDGKFRVFDSRSQSSSVHDVDLKRTSTSLKEFLSLCWSPRSTHIALNNRSDQVFILELRAPPKTELHLGTSISLQCEVNQMVWAKTGVEGHEALWIAGGGSPAKIHVFEAPILQKDNAAALLAHQSNVFTLAMDPQGRHIASGGQDCLVALWDPRHFICTRTFGFATQGVMTLSLNHNGSLLAWGTGSTGPTGGEKNITVVGADTGEMYWQDSTPAPVSHCKWHPQRNVLAYALNVNQLPEQNDRMDYRGRRGLSGRETANVHFLTVPE